MSICFLTGKDLNWLIASEKDIFIFIFLFATFVFHGEFRVNYIIFLNIGFAKEVSIMNTEQLIKNIEKLSAEKGINKTNALIECGAGKNFISNLMKGSEPSITKVQQIADYFGVTIDYLLGKTPEPSNISRIIPSDKIYKIPVFASVSAGFGAYADEDVVDILPMVIDNPYDVPDMIGIQVKGNSMYPKIENGDIIVVRKQESVDSGEVAVLLLDGNEGLVKKVVYGDDWIELHSFNPEYQTRRFDGAEVQRLRVVGKVLKVVKAL